MAISNTMRAALHALSYPAEIDADKTYRLERAFKSLSTPLSSLYHLWDHRIEREGREIRVRIYTPPKVADGRLLLFFHGGGWVLENIDTLLQEAGGGLQDIMQAIVYLRDPADYVVVKQYIESRYPSFLHLIVHAPVCRPGWLIETECIAVIPADAPQYAYL